MLKFLIALPSWGNKSAVFHSSGFGMWRIYFSETPAQQTYYRCGWGDWGGNECEIFNPVLNRSGYELYFLDSDKGERSSH